MPDVLGAITSEDLLRAEERLMMDAIELLDVVALLEDLPGRGLRRGQIGTVVEVLRPDVFEVEFSDPSGQTYATAALRAEQLMVLHDRPVAA